MHPDWIDLSSFSDPRGQLVAAEAGSHIPFAIARVFYILDVDTSKPRGFHAHREGELVAVCVRGHCDFVLDDGHDKLSVRLEGPARGLLVRPMIWHEMHDFSPGCILLVFASNTYDEADYIRDYAHFTKETR
tara:strand:+ start:824 stop:1219 length:396 start_codon:yes stop_codon:yes gene_type:complete